MALIYHDVTIETPIDLVLTALTELGQGVTFQKLGYYFGARSGFPANACNTIVKDALESCLKCKVIIKVRSRYYITPQRQPPKPRRATGKSGASRNKVKYAKPKKYQKPKIRRNEPKPTSG
ncbi:uncharacterized protein LOC111601516 [Drosophila hydei]|uniref:Uncharacterized protein LOC111601516 n=1 Tax=Drosophila hydei TaxID=7224 RepID=A0A6J1M6B5_DROHY|nr:uncharacterized protein LOC111601516 [Drosophila hydei]